MPTDLLQSEGPRHPRETGEITALLRRGDHDAVFERVYGTLGEIARRRLARHHDLHTLDTRALVAEAYAKLVGAEVEWQSRAHFFAVAAKAMREVALNYAQRKRAARRGGGAQKLPLDGDGCVVLPGTSTGAAAVSPAASSSDEAERRALELIALDAALRRLAELDERQAHVVELRFFGGLTVEEAADVLGVSERTVKRAWSAARLWLKGAMDER